MNDTEIIEAQKTDTVKIIETMDRDTGWITASTVGSTDSAGFYPGKSLASLFYLLARFLDDSKRLFPGEGVIDLRRFKEELESLGYKGFVSLELLRPSYWHQDPMQIARRGRESLRTIFEI